MIFLPPHTHQEILLGTQGYKTLIKRKSLRRILGSFVGEYNSYNPGMTVPNWKESNPKRKLRGWILNGQPINEQRSFAHAIYSNMVPTLRMRSGTQKMLNK